MFRLSLVQCRSIDVQQLSHCLCYYMSYPLAHANFTIVFTIHVLAGGHSRALLRIRS